jgi:hypothetical protein
LEALFSRPNEPFFKKKEKNLTSFYECEKKYSTDHMPLQEVRGVKDFRYWDHKLAKNETLLYWFSGSSASLCRKLWNMSFFLTLLSKGKLL